jgi:hypothetical protein
MKYYSPTGFKLRQLFSILKFLSILLSKKKVIVNHKKTDRVLVALVILLIVFDGFIFGKLNDLILTKHVKFNLVSALSLATGVIIVVKYIFPTFRTIRFVNNPYYNLNPVIKYSVSLFRDLFSFFYMVILLFFICFAAFSKSIVFTDIFSVLLLLFVYFHINRAIRTVFESKFNIGHIVYLFFGILTVWFYLLKVSNFYLLLLLVLIFIVSYYSYGQIAVQTKALSINIKSKNANTSALVLRYLLSANKIRSTIILLYLVKLVYLIGTSTGLLKFMAGYQFFYLVCILPILLFTYLFNNIFAFGVDLYRNVFFSQNIHKTIIRTYIYPLILVLLPLDLFIDILIFILQAFFGRYFKIIVPIDYSFFLLYFSVCLSLIAMSLVFSLKYPKTLVDSINKQTNTNFISSLVTLIVGIIAAVALYCQNTILICSVAVLNVATCIIFAGYFFRQAAANFNKPFIST